MLGMEDGRESDRLGLPIPNGGRRPTAIGVLAALADTRVGRLYARLLPPGSGILDWRPEMRYRGEPVPPGTSRAWLEEADEVYAEIVGTLILDGAIRCCTWTKLTDGPRSSCSTSSMRREAIGAGASFSSRTCPPGCVRFSGVRAGKKSDGRSTTGSAASRRRTGRATCFAANRPNGSPTAVGRTMPGAKPGRQRARTGCGSWNGISRNPGGSKRPTRRLGLRRRRTPRRSRCSTRSKAGWDDPPPSRRVRCTSLPGATGSSYWTPISTLPGSAGC